MKGYFLAVILFVAVLAPQNINAQILHIEQQDEAVDSASRWNGNLDFSMVLNNQDADTESNFNYLGLTTNLNLGYLAPQTAYLLLNHLNYMTTPKQAFISTGYSHFRINFLRKRKLSYEAFTQFQYDASRGLKRRWLGGAGLRYKLLEKGESTVYAGSGLMYENELWEHSGETTEVADIRMLKTTNYISGDIRFNKLIHLHTTAYYQTGYHKPADLWRHRISMDAQLKFKLTEKIAFNTTFASTFENRPVIPIKRFVYTLSNGISVKI
jgi:hypothetical protein